MLAHGRHMLSVPVTALHRTASPSTASGVTLLGAAWIGQYCDQRKSGPSPAAACFADTGETAHIKSRYMSDAHTYLLQALCQEILECVTPLRRISQSRWWVSADHKNDTQGVHLPARGCNLGHLYCGDPERPHIDLAKTNNKQQQFRTPYVQLDTHKT